MWDFSFFFFFNMFCFTLSKQSGTSFNPTCLELLVSVAFASGGEVPTSIGLVACPWPACDASPSFGHLDVIFLERVLKAPWICTEY